MGGDLERGLGLYAVVMVSVGAMIGSGLFVLPGLAASLAGPAVILAYVLAGLIAMPAALSKAEMATAMPESGGTYLYIDRAMGPLVGTISGIGVWFSLTFKSAFALVGLGAYLVLFTTLSTKLVALAIGAAVVGVNLVGVKQTGTIQAVIVTVVLAVLGAFGLGGLRFVEPANLQPFFADGAGGLLAATGFVFVSYAGVTKIASVAEEVEDPDRNIPLGMLGSMTLMIAVYAVIVSVIVGVVSAEELGHTLTPMADAASSFWGPVGLVAVAATAVLALASMSNAGVLSSSRYPLAMSRDDLAPPVLGRISDRFSTPTVSILLTGALLLGLVAFVPVIQLAKLASAFKILVFALVNVAVIALREGRTDWYEPAFRSPGYPWVQLFGIVGGLVLLTQMGTVPMLGAIGLVGAGIAWFFAYGKDRTGREGVGVDALRRRFDRSPTAEAEAWLGGADRTVLVGAGSTAPEGSRAIRETARSIAGPDGRVVVAGTPRSAVSSTGTGSRIPPAARILRAGESPDALTGAAERVGADVLLLDASRGPDGGDLEQVVAGASCDVVRCWPTSRQGPVEAVHVVSQRGGVDPRKVAIASGIATSAGAAVSLLHAVPASATDAQLATIRDHHLELADLCQPPVKSKVLRSADPVDTLVQAARRADVVVFGEDAGEDLDELVDRTRGPTRTVLTVHPRDRLSRFDRLRERVLYRL